MLWSTLITKHLNFQHKRKIQGQNNKINQKPQDLTDRRVTRNPQWKPPSHTRFHHHIINAAHVSSEHVSQYLLFYLQLYSQLNMLTSWLPYRMWVNWTVAWKSYNSLVQLSSLLFNTKRMNISQIVRQKSKRFHGQLLVQKKFRVDEKSYY